MKIQNRVNTGVQVLYQYWLHLLNKKEPSQVIAKVLKYNIYKSYVNAKYILYCLLIDFFKCKRRVIIYCTYSEMQLSEKIESLIWYLSKYCKEKIKHQYDELILTPIASR